jgi:acetyl-CoA carboxylase, biotin carboxylase subunit
VAQVSTVSGSFNRVLVANRGEVAVRVIRALHELDIEAVAVYSTTDKDSLHVRLSDRAVCIGPAPASESYLRIPSVIAAAATTRCQAVHPGWGFLAENAAFAEACAENDVVFIGPAPEVLARMGDKVSAREEMRVAGVPLVPGTLALGADEAARAGEELGYPVLLKACAGGGGKGMRLVESPDELEPAFATATAEADAAFGDGRLYVEKAIVPARHVEIQVLGDSHGGVLTLGERECSIQRRHQKLIEESPSPALTPELREEMEATAERAVRTIGYTNAGTFEFLLGPDGSFYFIELNARLQVEHPVTELVTGVDLVHEQLRVAAGEPLEHTGRAPRRGHAIEVRVNAEDPARGFLPTPGLIQRFRPPLGPGVRVDTHVEDGAEIPPHYDSLLGKVIAWGPDRDRALARCLRALNEFEVAGIPTTIGAAAQVIRSEGFAHGNYSTSYLDDVAASLPALAEAEA